jgi:hypothetical protein
VADAICYERVSATQFPAIRENNRENCDFEPSDAISNAGEAEPQPFFMKFPASDNREYFLRSREIISSSSDSFIMRVSVHFSHTCLVGSGCDLFSPRFADEGRTRWRTEAGLVFDTARRFGEHITRPGSRSKMHKAAAWRPLASPCEQCDKYPSPKESGTWRFR